jgi:hypothetical protein
MTISNRNLRAKYVLVRGDTFDESLELQDSEGEPISGWTWRFTVRASIPDTTTSDDTDALISKSGTFSDGKSNLLITSEETNIDPGEYFFDYQLTKPEGNIHSTFYGNFIVEGDITRDTGES